MSFLLVVKNLLHKQLLVVSLGQELNLKFLVLLHEHLVILINLLSHTRHGFESLLVGLLLVISIEFVSLPLFVCLLEFLLVLVKLIVEVVPSLDFVVLQLGLCLDLHLFNALQNLLVVGQNQFDFFRIPMHAVLLKLIFLLV